MGARRDGDQAVSLDGRWKFASYKRQADIRNG
jgi:hypothetical protein